MLLFLTSIIKVIHVIYSKTLLPNYALCTMKGSTDSTLIMADHSAEVFVFSSVLLDVFIVLESFP